RTCSCHTVRSSQGTTTSGFEAAIALSREAIGSGPEYEWIVPIPDILRRACPRGQRASTVTPCLINRTDRRAESGQGVVAMIRATGPRGAVCDVLKAVTGCFRLG